METVRFTNSFIGVMVILSFLTKGYSSIRCYECNSVYDTRCSDPFQPNELVTVDCMTQDPPAHLPSLKNVSASMCRKIMLDVDDMPRVSRGCGWIESNPPRDETSCLRRTDSRARDPLVINYCACKTDMCNNALVVTHSFIVMLALVITSMVATI